MIDRNRPAKLGLDTGEACMYCGERVIWGLSVNGRRCPFDPETSINHFTTCVAQHQAREERRAKQ